MERAGRSLSKLKITDELSRAELACSAWAVAVGRRISGYTTAIALVRGRLVVEVDDKIWQQQLFQLRVPILTRLREVIGDELITELEFRIPKQRRPPQRAEALSGSELPSLDEADRIQDPVLRKVYVNARKKASA